MKIPDGIVGIDMHVHLNDDHAISFKHRRKAQMAKHFGKNGKTVSVDDMADYYREHRMLAVLMNSIDRTVTGDTPLPNDYIAEVVQRHPDVFIGFGVVDPNEGRAAELEMVRCREELGLVGIGELNPARQHFAPNDAKFGRLWRAADELDLILLFHGGYAASGSGTLGGMGIKLRYSNPIYLDDVAADHPNLRIICAHPAWPWESEALAVAQHKRNVYLDLSGWAPKYFSEQVVKYVNSRISNKVIFGSDWPGISVDRWVSEFNDLPIKPEVHQKVMLDNAIELLNGSFRHAE